MNAERLLQNYERIAEAPDAIPRLRRFILDLAVRGKLVPQDSSDEPASELLKRIAAEKARLVKAGEIRGAHRQAIGENELRFPLPGGWSAERLAAIINEYISRSTSRGVFERVLLEEGTDFSSVALQGLHG
jgi:type I restriction enzyme, S subunit